MKLKKRYDGYCRAWLYQSTEKTYVLKVRKKDIEKYSTSLYNFVGENIGGIDSIFTVREASEVVVNGFKNIIENIPVDFRTHSLVIIVSK
jgi:hypothetical protein